MAASTMRPTVILRQCANSWAGETGLSMLASRAAPPVFRGAELMDASGEP